MVDQPGAIAMWVPDNIMFNSTDATWLCIHKTAGFQTAQDVAVYFQNGSNGENVSSHYVVGLDGTIVQCVPENRGAGANCCTIGAYASYLPYCDGRNDNMNLHTISIEHVDPADDNSTPVPDAQKAASFKLIHDICQRHNIPMRSGDASGGIIGHRDIDPVNRARCPGNYPWDELWAYLNSNTQGANDMIDISDPWVAGYFQDISNGQWKCKVGGHIIGGNILKYWRVMQGGPRLPQTDEIKNIPNHPEVAYQVCESGILVFDPNHVLDGPNMPSGYGCYMLKFGSDLAKQLLGQSSAEVQALTAKLAQANQLATQLVNATK